MTLLQRIEDHLKSSGQSASLFGKHAGGDTRLVFDLRRGRRPRKALRAQLEKILENKA